MARCLALARRMVDCMDQDSRRLYNALTARDSRFDGVFFVGVTSTDIYCRPICPVKTPKEANCRFFDTPQEAEQAGFRPCLRCRPELAPGSAPVDDAQRIAQLIVQRLEEGHLDEKAGLEEIADQFELSSRQIRRIVQKELGVPPIQLLLTRRLLLAKQLLTETALPITEVAFASGFSSLRRFNDAFNTRYGMPPTRLRKKATEGAAAIGDEPDARRCSSRIVRRTTGRASSRFWRPARSTGIEHVTGRSYARTVQLGDAKGWIRVTQSKKKHALMLEFTHSLTPVLPALLSRVRALFDLNARPDLIAKHLRRDARLASGGEGEPGPAGARRLQRIRDGPARDPRPAGHRQGGDDDRLPVRRGVRRADRHAVRGTESADAVARPASPPPASTTSPGTASSPRAAGASSRWRRAQEIGALCLDGGAHHNPDDSIKRLAELPGIGPWTAHYIAMRALRWPDAFPEGRHRRAQQPRWRHGERGRGAVPAVAALAELCGHARLGDGTAKVPSSDARRRARGQSCFVAVTSLVAANGLPYQKRHPSRGA